MSQAGVRPQRPRKLRAIDLCSYGGPLRPNSKAPDPDRGSAPPVSVLRDVLVLVRSSREDCTAGKAHPGAQSGYVPGLASQPNRLLAVCPT